MIKGLHHNAYRCRDSEQTRQFYEDFLGLPLAGTLEIRETKSGRKTAALHTFYRLDDGSFLAFFEAPDMPFAFKPQHDEGRFQSCVGRTEVRVNGTSAGIYVPRVKMADRNLRGAFRGARRSSTEKGAFTIRCPARWIARPVATSSR